MQMDTCSQLNHKKCEPHALGIAYLVFPLYCHNRNSKVMQLGRGLVTHLALRWQKYSYYVINHINCCQSCIAIKKMCSLEIGHRDCNNPAFPGQTFSLKILTCIHCQVKSSQDGEHVKPFILFHFIGNSDD